MAETAVTVLCLMRGEQHIVGKFEEDLVIAAGGTRKSIGDSCCMHGWHNNRTDEENYPSSTVDGLAFISPVPHSEMVLTSPSSAAPGSTTRFAAATLP